MHLWSVEDRIRLTLESCALSRVVDLRNYASYRGTTGMTGPCDAHIYVPELVTSVEIAQMDEDTVPFVHRDKREEFCSSYNFTMSTIVPETTVVISASRIAALKDETENRSRPWASS